MGLTGSKASFRVDVAHRAVTLALLGSTGFKATRAASFRLGETDTAKIASTCRPHRRSHPQEGSLSNYTSCWSVGRGSSKPFFTSFGISLDSDLTALIAAAVACHAASIAFSTAESA
jgi:hypothetical protein